VQQELTELLNYYKRATTTKAVHKREEDTDTQIPQEMQNISKCKPSPELTGLSHNDSRLSADQQEVTQLKIENAQLPSLENETLTTSEVLSPETNNIEGHDENQRMISLTDKQIKIENELSMEIFTTEGSGRGRRRSKFVTTVKLLLQPETLRPLFLIVSFFSFYGFGGMPSIRPFLVEVIDSFHTPIEGTWSSVSLSIYST
jgi:hypothetical protein